jgi:peptidylprolyl isomerase domain and WD repeat-containing protein 1
MADSTVEDPVLGKRARDDATDAPMDVTPTAAADESDDEDMGPMPLPASSTGAAKKKRKGVYLAIKFTINDY